MEFEHRLSLSQMMLAECQPFFATLCLYADVRLSTQGPTAWTNGRKIWFNPDFADALENDEFIGLLVHEILHCALMHASRRGDRDPRVFNLAADIVINGMIDEVGLKLPKGAVRHDPWKHFSTEEVYALLQAKCPEHLKPLMESFKADIVYVQGDEETKSIQAHWEIANQNAALQSRMMPGSGSAELERIFAQLTAPQIDWRTRLWEFMVRTPCDFTGFDRRFIHQGLYLDCLDGETCSVYICCDTSGSIDQEQLTAFISELKGILASYPDIKARLWYADSELSEAYDLDPGSEIPMPTGGGGTSFEPFFEEIAKEETDPSLSAAIYLTDGFGEFPSEAPEIRTLWVVTPGGAQDEDFPFGITTRLLEN